MKPAPGVGGVLILDRGYEPKNKKGVLQRIFFQISISEGISYNYL